MSVFVLKKHCVFCEVRTEFVYIIFTNLILKDLTVCVKVKYCVILSYELITREADIT